MPNTHEFRVRRVERYVITEYRNDDIGVGSRPLFEVADRTIANDIVEALAKAYDAKATTLESA